MSSTAPTTLVVSRAPVPGRAKTRLAASVGDEAAALLAANSLLDTLDAATAAGGPVVVAMQGDLAEAALGDEIDAALRRHTVIGQRGDEFGQRLANAHADADRGYGVVQIGMDTPQVSARVLLDARDALTGHDAAFGPAADGGWWVVAVREARYAEILRDVPMSTPSTGSVTREALRGSGLRVGDLSTLTDVDTWSDALEVAASSPGTRFGRCVARTRHEREERAS